MITRLCAVVSASSFCLEGFQRLPLNFTDSKSHAFCCVDLPIAHVLKLKGKL